MNREMRELEDDICYAIRRNDMSLVKTLLAQVTSKFTDLWLIDTATIQNKPAFIAMLIPVTVHYKEQTGNYFLDPYKTAVNRGYWECAQLLEPVSDIMEYL